MQQGIETVTGRGYEVLDDFRERSTTSFEKRINEKIRKLNAEGKIVINVSMTSCSTTNSSYVDSLLATILWQKS